MAGTTLPGRLSWVLADVIKTIAETPTSTSLALSVPGWRGHLAGQHIDIRLTAADGYQAQRSYSIASAPGGERIEITVERIDDGEVSPYLAGALQAGDKLELRGPIGGYFTWETGDGGPLLLIAGGSGIVPLMAMIRHRAATGSQVPTRLLYSSRSAEEIIYHEELAGLTAADTTLELVQTVTRSQPADWTGYRRRIDEAMLTEVAWPVEERPLGYICGPTPFVENVASMLLTFGHAPERIKTERFGPTGG